MINPDDLMRGNWVLDPKGNPIKVLDIVRCFVDGVGFYDGLNDEINSETCSPIPLTTELMEQMGWLLSENVVIYAYEKQHPNRCLIFYNDGKIAFAGGRAGQASETFIQYLHELQNLYRWTVGKPLQINL